MPEPFDALRSAEHAAADYERQTAGDAEFGARLDRIEAFLALEYGPPDDPLHALMRRRQYAEQLLKRGYVRFIVQRRLTGNEDEGPHDR